MFDRARKYYARIAIVLEEREEPKISILEERFKGKCTWAHPYYRKPLAEVDKRLRDSSIKGMLYLIEIGDNIYGPGKDFYGKEIVPKDFSGIMVFDIEEHSNGLEGVSGLCYKEVKRVPYHRLEDFISKNEVAKAS